VRFVDAMQRRGVLPALTVLLASDAVAPVIGAGSHHRGNPVRKVISMMNMMAKKIEGEGKKAEEMYDAFMCYCNDGDESLKKSVEEAEDKVPQLESSLKEATAGHAQLQEDLKQHKADVKDAKEAVETATAIRGQEKATFDKDAANLKTNIDSVNKAVKALAKGMGAGFLQSQNTAVAVLKKLSVSMDMSNTDRDVLSAFLSTSSTQGADPASGEILGILKQMNDEQNGDLASMVADEETATASFDSLVAAKAREVAALTKAIESKTARVGELAVEVATLKNDLEDTSEQLAMDKKFLAELETSCVEKKKEWAIYEKTQKEELLALADTIKLLNDDDALDLFKKTLPSGGSAASFLQLQGPSVDETRQAAIAALQGARRKGKGNPQLDLLAMGLRGKKEGFDGVIQQINKMTSMIAKEQGDDDGKKKYCEIELDKAEDDKTMIERGVSDTKKILSDTKGRLESVSDEIQSLSDGILKLDKQVQKQTDQRKEEHAQYTEDLAANNAAKSLLEMAKNRLSKFYNPKLYKAPPKRDLSEEDQITTNMGGTLAPTQAPGGIAGTGIESFMQVRMHEQLESDDVSSQPEADLGYEKKSAESGGVMGLIDMLMRDLGAQNAEMEHDEKVAQSDYEEFIKDSAEKRAEDSKVVGDKEGAKAELESELDGSKGELKSKKINLMDTVDVIANLHGDCDWLLKNYDVRKEARTSESESLTKASAVLSGASFS